MSISCTASRHTISVNFSACPAIRGGSGKLYVMFADCSANWDALEIMQRAAGGMINQIGIWTEQPLWKANGASEQYNLNLVKGLNDVAVGLAEQNQPLSLILSAKSFQYGGGYD